MSAIPDLIDLSTAQTDLAVILPTNQDALPLLITAASNAIRKWTKRDFTQRDYTQDAAVQTLDGRGFSEISTKQYPVNSVSRLSTGAATVLSVSNTDNVTNQRATAALTVTGDTVAGLVVTGLSLKRVASGVNSTSTILFSTYLTTGAAAAAITALGGGWKGTAAGNYDKWPTADLLPTTGAQGCIGTGQADFQAYVTDVSTYDFDPMAGIIRLRNQTFDPVFALMNMANTSQLSVFPLGWRGVRVEYNAGYATIPADVQTACLITIKDWIYKLQITTHYSEEGDVDWHAAIAPWLTMQGIPDAAKQILGPHRSYRNY